MSKTRVEKQFPLAEMVNNFTDIINSDTCSEQYKSDPKFKKKIEDLMSIFNTWSRAAGVTEYSSTDGGYNGDEFLEKYKNDIRRSWKGKSEKKNAIKKITKEEISDGHQSYLAKKMALTNKRNEFILSLENKANSDDCASSEEEDDIIINRLLRSNNSPLEIYSNDTKHITLEDPRRQISMNQQNQKK